MTPDAKGAEKGSYTPPALKHGAFSMNLVTPRASELLDVVDQVCSGTPAEDPRFAPARALLAHKLARLSLVSDYLNERHGGSPVGAKGQLIKAARLEMDLMAAVEKTLGELGLTPAAAGKLGVDLARGQNLTEGIDQARAARKRADVRIDGPADDEDTNAA